MIFKRRNTFETNSSSTHSLVIVSKEDYDKFLMGEKVLNLYENEMLDIDEDKRITRTEDNDFIYKGRHYSNVYDIFDENMEDFDEEYAPKDFIYYYGESIDKAVNKDKMAMSIYLGERW